MVTASDSDGPARISVLGATGSIGRSTLDLLGREPDRWRVVALVAGRDAAALAEAARAHRAEHAVVADPAAYRELAERLDGTGIAVSAGPDAVVAAAGLPTDIVVSAVVGAAGLAPSLAALGATRVLALANKETMVCAGALVTREAARRGVAILPVDSEHNAIFQVLERANADAVSEIILTASGGPFRTLPLAEMASITRERALAHPNWSMGRKVTIDSSTLMNKGLELIEAHHLFATGPDRLSVVVHPQSVVHSLVRYVDGSVLAQLGSPDMRTPIAVCLAWPRRRPAPVKPLDLAAVGTLTFEEPDRARFPCLALAESALRAGGGATCALNAANEIAVDGFLDGRIGWLDIAAVVDQALSRAAARDILKEPASLDEALALDADARGIAAGEVAARARRGATAPGVGPNRM